MIEIEHLFPRTEPNAIIDSDFYVELFNNDEALKLQKKLSKCAPDVAARHVAERCSVLAEGICESDIIATHSRTSSVFVLTAPLSNPTNRIPPTEFVAWMRFFLRIPQLVRLG